MRYTILNASVIPTERAAIIDERPVIVREDRLVVEAVPGDGLSGTLRLVLPAEDAGIFVEGAVIEAEFTVVRGD